MSLFVRKVAVVIAAVITLALLWAVRDVLLLVFVAAVLAAGIAPAVRWVRLQWRYRFGRKISRGPAVMIVYLPFLVGVLLMTIFVVPRFVAETRDLGAQLPRLIEENVLTPLERYVPVATIRAELQDGVEVPRARVFFYVRSAATVVASLIAILFMVAYMLIDADRLRNLFLLIYPPDRRGERQAMLRRVGRKMSSWLSGQLLLAAIIGVSSYAAFLALRIPYALPLAILAAVGELVPVIGPTIGAIPALAIAMLHSRWQFWSVLAFAIVLQKVENLLIVPRVMSRKVEVSPLAIFIAFMMGAALLGILGAIIAVPAAVIMQVVFEEAFVARRERRTDVDRAGTLFRRVQ
jgi:predicted PurR-regulated permease PerM